MKSLMHGLLLLLLALSLHAGDSLLQPADRILFLGDSITEHGHLRPNGYYHQFTNLLQKVYPEATHSVVSLGFSGNTTYSWADSIEPRSRTESVWTHGKGFDVHLELGKKADIVFIFLGMNELLQPLVSSEQTKLLEWQEKQRGFIRTIRERVSPRLVFLCEITPLTDDRLSPKNLVRERMWQLSKELAQEEGCLTANTGTHVRDAIEYARTLRQDYLVVPDTVHPSFPLGHSALTVAFAEALQDKPLLQAAQSELQRHYDKLRPTEPTIIYHLSTTPGIAATNALQSWQLACYWHSGTNTNQTVETAFRLSLPTGWNSTSELINQSVNSAHFNITGNPEKLQTPVTITVTYNGKEYQAQALISAPWRVIAGPDNPRVWGAANLYQPDQSVPFMEEPLVAGTHFDQPFEHEGQRFEWQLSTPVVGYTEGHNPNSVNPFSITFGSNRDVLYAVRWIYSEKDRPVELELSHKTFSATLGFVVWLNGQKVITASLDRQGNNRTSQTGQLKKGWNTLLLRNDHSHWQRQFACTLLPIDNDTLESLRYSAFPPSPVQHTP